MNTRKTRQSPTAKITLEAEAAQRLALEVAALAGEFAQHADTGDFGTLGSIQEIRRALVEILARRSPTYAISETAARNEILAEQGLI